MGVKHLFDITGKTALITGAGQGIGRSIALALAEHGANVVINYRSNHQLAEATLRDVLKMGTKAWLWEYDLLSDTLASDFQLLLQKLGIEVDILVLNASIQIRKKWEDVTLSEFNTQMNVNVRASLELMQCCVPHMESKGWGRIVTLGSVQQNRPSKQMIVYAASKAAQLNMVKNLAWQLGNKGITINNLAPGVIGTVRNEEVLSNEVFKTKIEKNIPKNVFNIDFREDIETNDIAYRIALNEVMLEILCGKSSHLYNKLNYKGLISSELTADYLCGNDYGLRIIGGESNNIEEILSEISQEVERYVTFGICDENLKRVVKAVKNRNLFGNESLENICSAFADCFTKGIEVLDIYAKYDIIKSNDIREELKTFSRNNRVLSVVGG